jgi:hypothetical protein
MNMDKKRVHAFHRRWQAVQEVQQKELINSSLEMKWRQLNAAHRLGKGLQFSADHPDEMHIYLRWAKLKEKQTQRPKA